MKKPKVKRLRYLKFIFRVRKFFGMKHFCVKVMNEEEKYIFFMILKLLKKEGTKILIRPISDVIHIQSEDESYYFIVGPGKIKFTNHKYLIDIVISEDFFNKTRDIIFNKIERERKAIEDKIFISKLKILNDITKDLEKN